MAKLFLKGLLECDIDHYEKFNQVFKKASWRIVINLKLHYDMKLYKMYMKIVILIRYFNEKIYRLFSMWSLCK